MLKKLFKNRRQDRNHSTSSHLPTGLGRSSNILNRIYRRISSKALSMAVKPKVFGELPDLEVFGNTAAPSANSSITSNNHTSDNSDTTSDSRTNVEGQITAHANTDTTPTIEPITTLTFYVLKEYSRSNSLLIDLQTREQGFPPALISVEDTKHNINENAAIIFLHHPNAGDRKLSPRLARLIAASKQYPDLNIQLVPVSILWGRAPDKEDSLFRLLMADNWEEPSITKQLFNIGVMGRDTFVQFHPPQALSSLIQSNSAIFANDEGAKNRTKHNDEHSIKLDSELPKAQSSTALVTADTANIDHVLKVQQQLNTYLDMQRTTMLGPDLSDKRNLCDKLIYSPAIRHAIEIEANEKDISEREARKIARGYANEIVNDYSYSVIRFFDRFLTWLWTQLYDGVEVHHFERVRKLATDYELVYVPCHRSHIDYLLLSYVIYKRGLSLPYIAAGNNLDVPIIGAILRSAVAFYIRRSFKDNALYTAVLREYLHTLITRNTPIEYFIEGGRSRSGRLLPPKLGMLAMTVQSQLRHMNKPVAFIPTYIGYERIMEGGTYIGELKGKPKESESLLGILKVSRKIERIFGHVHVSFGTPLFLEDFMQKYNVEKNILPPDRTDTPLDLNTKSMIENISIKVMQNINKAAVINPISILSLVLLSTPRAALDEKRCREQIALYQSIATDVDYHQDIRVTDMSPQAIINYGIKLKIVERRPHMLGDIIQVADRQKATLSYFRNNILHVFILPSFISALVVSNGRIDRDRLNTIIEQLYPFLQSELFLYYPARTILDTVSRKLDSLIEHGLVVDMANNMLGAPERNTEKYQQLKVLANPVEQSLERYFMTLALLAQQGSGELTAQQVIDLCHLLGQRLSVLYADDIPDFFDPALFKSFVEALIRLDYMQKDDKSGLLYFDQRINDIARHANFILSTDVMQVLRHVATLSNEEIERTIAEINYKKQRKFGLKR